MSKEKQVEEELDQDYDVLLDDESWGNSTVTIIATIILTMATISGVGYWFHLKSIDALSDSFETRLLKVETRLVNEIRIDNIGSLQIAELEEKLALRDAELEGLRAELVSAESGLLALREELADNEVALSDLSIESESEKMRYEGTIAELNGKVNSLEARVNVINSRIQITE